MTILVSLIGEQPVPNLLPVRHLQPATVVLVHTERTRSVAEHLQAVIGSQTQTLSCLVDAFQIEVIGQELDEFIHAQGWPADQITFNLTGGTKPMALAAYGWAQRHGCPALYLQSSGNRSSLFRYEFVDGQPVPADRAEIPESIALDDYLRAYVADYNVEGLNEPFEQAVAECLRGTPEISELLAGVRLMGALEIDLIIRCGNQVGIVEVKRKAVKRSVDQLNAPTDQRYLGTYIRKFLISATEVDRNNRELAEAYRIQVIELTDWQSGNLSEASCEKVIRQISSGLGVHS